MKFLTEFFKTLATFALVAAIIIALHLLGGCQIYLLAALFQ